MLVPVVAVLLLGGIVTYKRTRIQTAFPNADFKRRANSLKEKLIEERVRIGGTRHTTERFKWSAPANGIIFSASEIHKYSSLFLAG
jgi:hypothetical protein